MEVKGDLAIFQIKAQWWCPIDMGSPNSRGIMASYGSNWCPVQDKYFGNFHGSVAIFCRGRSSTAHTFEN